MKFTFERLITYLFYLKMHTYTEDNLNEHVMESLNIGMYKLI